MHFVGTGFFHLAQSSSNLLTVFPFSGQVYWYLHRLFNSSLLREVQVPSSVVTVMNYNTQKNEHLFFSYLSLLNFCFVLRLKSHYRLALLSCSSYLILSGAGIVDLFSHAYFPHLLINFGYYFISSNYLGSILEYFHNKYTIKIIYVPIFSNFS